MTELAGYDAAYAPGNPPAADRVVMGYLGGDTPHTWTPADWNSQRARFRIGIWTRSNPQGAAQGAAEGRAAAAALKALGATPGSLHVLDYETAVNGAYVSAFDAAMVAAGFKVALYGSKSTVFQNPRMSGGYFPADLTGQPHLYPGTLLTQWKFEQAWDDDTVSAAAVLWDTTPGVGMSTVTIDQASADLVKDTITNLQRGVVTTPHTGGGTSTIGSEILALPTRFDRLTATLADIDTKVSALQAPQIDYAKLAAALTADPGFAAALKAAEPKTFTGNLS